MEIKTLGGTGYQIMDANKSIELTEERFIDDDLTQLCNLGLLIPDATANGNRLFKFTRAAVRFIDQVNVN